MKPTRKNPMRRTEVFTCVDDPLLIRPFAVWKTIKFNNLKKGDIFRLWDTGEDGKEVPDQVVRGQHVVNVALEDAKPMRMPMLAVVRSAEVRGFRRRTK